MPQQEIRTPAVREPGTETMQEIYIEDPRFGTVEVTVDPTIGYMSVQGPRVPRASIRRSLGIDSDHRSPIGSRAPSHLELVVDGHAVPLDTGIGFLSRRSRRVEVDYNGHRYRFAPVKKHRSVLTRDGRLVGELARKKPEAGVSPTWDPGADAAPAEAALVYVLAAAFGVGAPGFVTTAIGAGLVSPPF